MATREIRKGTTSDIAAIHSLILEVAEQHVFPTLRTDGRRAFRDTLGSDIEDILEKGVYLLAESQSLVGVCGFRSNGHVNHLFVRSSDQGQGVGKMLLISAQLKLSPQTLNLNASLNAIGFYESLGFEPIGEAGEVNGVKFQHMTLGNLLADG